MSIKVFREQYSDNVVLNTNLGFKQKHLTNREYIKNLGEIILKVDLFKLNIIEIIDFMYMVYRFMDLVTFKKQTRHDKFIEKFCKRKDLLSLLECSNFVNKAHGTTKKLCTLLREISYMDKKGYNKDYKLLNYEFYGRIFIPFISCGNIYLENIIMSKDKITLNRKSMEMLEFIIDVNASHTMDIQIDYLNENLWNLINDYWMPQIQDIEPGTETKRLVYISNTVNELVSCVSRMYELGDINKIREGFVISENGAYVKLEVMIYQLTKLMYDELCEDSRDRDIISNSVGVLTSICTKLVFTILIHIYSSILIDLKISEPEQVYDCIRRLVEVLTVVDD